MRNSACFALAVAAITSTINDAGATGEWCVMYTTGSENCGYSSYEQCRASASGLEANCQPNPFPGTNFGRGFGSSPTRDRRYNGAGSPQR